MFEIFDTDYSIIIDSYKSYLHISTAGKHIWKLSELNTLHGGLLEMTLSVPVRMNLLKKLFEKNN